MSNPIQHHYVPRSFFRPWEDKNRQVIVYEKKDGGILPPYRQSTKSICVKDGLYSYTNLVEEEKRHIIETKFFCLIDTNAASVLQKLYNMQGLLRITDQDRYYFSVFLVSLRIRTPESFEYNTKHAEFLLKESLQKKDARSETKEVKDALKGQNLLEWVEKEYPIILENYGHELMAEYVIDARFIKPIHEMHWAILHTQKNSGIPNLLSSDRPLVMIHTREDRNFGFAISIAPDRIFIANRNLKVIKDFLAIPSNKLVQQMNISTVQQAKAKAFAIDKSHNIRFFQNRLGTFHHILPWTDHIVEPSTVSSG